MEHSDPPPEPPHRAAHKTDFSWLKPAVFTAGMLPLAVLFWRWRAGLLDANPIAEVLNQFGMLALIFLILSLACTPVQWRMQWNWPLRVRKLLGLLAFFYALLHFGVYLAIDKSFQLGDVFADVWKRKFILAGFTAFLLLIPLAATSTKGMIRRLGARRWQQLHRLAYVAGILAVIHFFLRVKVDITEPMIYGLILAVLLGARIAAKYGAKPAVKTAPID